MPEDKRTTILKTAMKVIAENGFHNSPISVIAGQAGVSVGTMYRYFNNKDELIEAVYEHEDEKINNALMAGDSADMPFRERFIRILSRFIEYIYKNINVLIFLEQYYHSPYGIDKMRERMDAGKGPNESMSLMFIQAKEEQIVKNLDNVLLFNICFAPLVFLLKDHSEGIIELTDDLKEQAVNMVWNAIKM